jgi:hypothetical protein
VKGTISLQTDTPPRAELPLDVRKRAPQGGLVRQDGVLLVADGCSGHDDPPSVSDGPNKLGRDGDETLRPAHPKPSRARKHGLNAKTWRKRQSGRTDPTPLKQSSYAIGGGVPSALARSAGSQSHTAHAWLNAERAKSSAAACGSELEHTSWQSRTYSPSVSSQRAAAGASVAPLNPSGAGCA